MPNEIVVKIEALDYTITERDVAEALKSHFPNMPTAVHEIQPDPVTKNESFCQVHGDGPRYSNYFTCGCPR